MAVQPIAVPPSLAAILNQAGEKSGVDFDYLLQTAIRESSLNPTARAATSSATGLFQFIESTWFEVLKTEGPELGYQRYADMIVPDSDGGYTIPDRTLRREVLKLREDPQMAADLAAAFTRRNGEFLKERFGRMPSPGELYIAHFMGARGAESFFRAGLENPDRIAAELFPRQARANRPIFYANGEPRTIREVYQALVSRHNNLGPSAAFTAQQMATAAPAPAPAAPERVEPTTVSPLAIRAVAPPPDGPNVVPSRFAPDAPAPAFTAMFTTVAATGEGRGAAGGAERPFFDPLAGLVPREEEPKSRFFSGIYGE